MTERPPWVVAEAESRATAKGLSSAERLVLSGDGDQQIEVVTYRPGGDGETFAVSPIPLVPPLTAGVHFDLCPICLTPQPDTDEHIPQADLGGRVLTKTCSACNNKLGSKVEPHLFDWFDDAVRDYTISGPGVPGGRRNFGRVLIRQTRDGEPVALFTTGKKVSDDFTKLMTNPSRKVETTFRPPPDLLVSLAVLKHAYLAACLLLQAIPNTPLARVIRADLLAARDAPRKTMPVVSATAMSLRFMRTHLPATDRAISLDAVETQDGRRLDLRIHLAGTLSVSWPLESWLLHYHLEQLGLLERSGIYGPFGMPDQSLS